MFVKSPKKIVVIGDVIMDKYSIGRVNRLSPEAPVPILSVEEEQSKPGGAGNVALNLSKLSQNSNIYFYGYYCCKVSQKSTPDRINISQLFIFQISTFLSSTLSAVFI